MAHHTVYETLFVLLLSKYDVIDSSEIRGLLRKSTDPPGRFCRTGQFAIFEALYLRLTGSVFVPVKNVVFLMLRTFTRLSILNLRSWPFRFFCENTRDSENPRKLFNELSDKIPLLWYRFIPQKVQGVSKNYPGFDIPIRKRKIYFYIRFFSFWISYWFDTRIWKLVQVFRGGMQKVRHKFENQV